MNLLELRSFIRERLDDEVEPYQWSDTFITAAINRAEREASERALLLTSEKTIDVLAGGADYALPASTIVVKSLSINGKQLDKVSVIELDSHVNKWRELIKAPEYYIQNGNNIKLVGIPLEDATINLSIINRPENKLVNDIDIPEIPEEWHEDLLFYVLYEAYSRRDEDLFDPNAAQFNLSQFTELFGRKHSAKFMTTIKSSRANSRVYPRKFV